MFLTTKTTKGLPLMKSTAIVDRINEYIQQLPSSYDRPARKFVRDLLGGILTSKSTILSDIARAIAGNSSRQFRAVNKRICRRLDEVELEEAYSQQSSRAIREISDDTVIAVDIGDITKPAAKSMEGLAKVADGSDSHKIKSGYWMIGAVAVNPKSEDKTPQPLALEVYSSTSESFYSENAVVNETISNIFHRSGGKGVFTIDRGGDRGRILQPLIDLNAKFVVRLQQRHVTIKGTNETIKVGKREIERKALPYKADLERRRNSNGKRVPLNLRVDFKEVTVKPLKHEKELYLVTAWSLKSRKPMELLTSKPVKNLSQAIDIVIAYLGRWSVEETYRFLKSSLDLEKMQVRTLGKIKNLVKACFIATSILARTLRHKSWKNLYERNCSNQKTATDELFNWLYRAAEGCSNLLKKHMSKLQKANKAVYHSRKITPLEKLLFPVEYNL